MRKAFLLGALLLSSVDANADGLTLLQLHDIRQHGCARSSRLFGIHGGLFFWINRWSNSGKG